jgi:alkylhydroperoxidase family enzyme
LKEGCTTEQFDALRVGSTSPAFDARDRAVLAYAEAMTRDIRVPEVVFQQVREMLTEREVVELTATIAGYNLVSRFLEAMAIDHE